MTPRIVLVIVVFLILLALVSLTFSLSEKAAEPEGTVRIRPRFEVVAIPTTTSTSTTTTVAPRARSAPLIRTASVSAGVPDEVWDRIAACESGQRWDDTRGGYEGGLHFLHDTWVRAGGRRFAEHAYQATRRQQIDIANEWLARTSWRQWPTCSRRLGLR